MINYTERIGQLMADIVARVPTLSFLDMARVLVFARAGRSDAEGPYATCHCVCLPPSEPGYYFWRDRRSGALTRRSEWFITKSPTVTLGSTHDRLHGVVLAAALLRSVGFDELAEADALRSATRRGSPSSTRSCTSSTTSILNGRDPPHGARGRDVLGELPRSALLRRRRRDGEALPRTNPDPCVYDFLKCNLAELTERYGGVAGTAFRSFPSYPQRFTEVLDPQPRVAGHDDCRVEPLKLTRTATAFTERDLTVREFLPHTSRVLLRERAFRAA